MKKKFLIFKVIVLSTFLIISCGMHLYIRFHDYRMMLISKKDINDISVIKISTINEFPNEEHKEIVINEKEKVQEFLKPIKGKVFIGNSGPAFISRWGEYKIEIGDKYTIVFNRPERDSKKTISRITKNGELTIIDSISNQLVYNVRKYLEID